jgi:hypothetical protein
MPTPEQRAQVDAELASRPDPTVSKLVQGETEHRARGALRPSYQPGKSPNRVILENDPTAGSNIRRAGSTR